MSEVTHRPQSAVFDKTSLGDIPKTMQAVVCYAPGDYRLEEVDVPTPGPGEMLCRVELAGICMSDVKVYHGAPSFWGDETQPRYVKPPMIPGHEFVCHVAALGEGVESIKGFKVGDRVISEQIVPCWDCRYCKRGQYWMCEKHDLYGFQNNVQGAFAQYMIFTKEGIVHGVPDHVPADEAVLTEPLACSLHAADRAQVTPDDIVVVAGAGTLGLGIIGQIALQSPAKLIVLDLKPERAEFALRLGADEVWNPAEEDVIEKIKSITDGYGCDIYVEATGYHKAVNQGIHMLRKLGRFVEFSVFGSEVTLDWSIISDRKELDILGSHLGPYTYPRAIDFIATRKLDLRGMVTHTYPMSQFHEALGVMERGDKSLKVAIDPHS
ncbi:MAG: alcohol dehydrogenase catalytic domain-containing protein [Salinisphaera sp.]|jgi:threonine dehydrogenase-like Zn-dependent dehydrogenase|nr:alcohol dehydrogenase catalytic domain-containing protein [Salinisphaera sp.]